MSTMRHVVMWTLNDRDSADDTVHTMKAKLEALVGVVPGLISLSVQRAALVDEGNWDVVLISDHESLEAFRTYQTHPAHLEVASWVTQQVDQRAAVDVILNTPGDQAHQSA